MVMGYMARLSQLAGGIPGGLMHTCAGFVEKPDIPHDQTAQTMDHEIGHALAFVNHPNDRLTEHEADRIGVELAARAGYDPAAAVTLWDKLGQLMRNKRAHFLSTHPSSEQQAQTLNDMQAPMRKFQTRALDAQAGQAPGQDHANNHGHGHEHDWLNAPKASRPAIDESKAIALYSPRWEDFEMGCIELKGSNTPGFVMKQRALKEMHDQARWRDLASTVMDLDHRLDLSYHCLGVAAKGIGFEVAERHYLERARQLSENKTVSCKETFLLSCEAFAVAREMIVQFPCRSTNRLTIWSIAQRNQLPLEPKTLCASRFSTRHHQQ